MLTGKRIQTIDRETQYAKHQCAAYDGDRANIRGVFNRKRAVSRRKRSAARCTLAHGQNVLEAGRKKTLISIIARQFKNLMIIVLLAAAVISALLSEVSDAIIIFVVILLKCGDGDGAGKQGRGGA